MNNTNETEHTSTPWNREDGAEDSRGSVIFGPDGETIAETPGGNFDGKNGDPEDRANAAFIVRAANAHDELVSIAEMFLWVCETQIKGPIEPHPFGLGVMQAKQIARRYVKSEAKS